MSYLDRILHDGVDRAGWENARRPVLGASDAAHLAKMSSVDKYLAAKLGHGSFHGNEYTESGHRWEPMMLAWAGIPQNIALFHSPAEPGFACTPDGIAEVHGGRSLRLAEAKAKHLKIVDGPSVSEWRQLAFQFEVLPEATEIEFIWVELDAAGEIRAGRHGEPCSITVRRDHPKILAARAQIMPIAAEVLARLRVALTYERSAA
ncbi:hypothetical protein [Humibacter ginsenosidimutans]|uniref:YqaJ viral recombinase family protein n=1 Tax=Humibacter ginsenosidimutans TaxID=2599293 RepID=A0A5B8M510_9MICO|nr:hypothetical protein [Humibacter ginsenosidimutans]QDZ15808.1 hypothetical protein FPZ11_14465 [Humibacter ginsenosidimutans]